MDTAALDTSTLDRLNFRLTYGDVASATRETQDFLRREIQTNLRFLANCVLRPASKKFLSLTERCHGRMIDLCMRPDPARSFGEWSPIKERVTIASRGILKSTIVGAHLIQCQLADPDIRILIVSGKMSLAKTILDTARLPFVTNEVLRFLFPDWAVEATDIGGEDFVCPRRDPTLNLRDPTLSIATFESVKAGGHYELVLFDDCTNEINCATPEYVEKCEQCYDDTDPLVEPGGYRHFWGTTWAPPDADLPEVIRRRGEVYAEEHNGEQNTAYLRLPAWTVRLGATPQEQTEIEQRDRRDQLHPEDVILTWPEKLSSKVLWPKYRAAPNKFNKQYLLKFKGSLIAESFPREKLLSSTRPFAEGAPMPHDRFLVVHWDLSSVYSGVRNIRASDFSCGMAVMFELSTRRMFIYDAILEVFSSSTDMATAIVDFYVRQSRVDRVGACSIEDAHGARYLQGEIDGIAKRSKTPLVINWILPISKADSKALNITRLAGAMKKGLVEFSTSLPQRDEIFRQFEKWTSKNKRVKDDAPDCAAQIWSNYSDQIFPGAVAVLQANPDSATFFPEILKTDEDSHADERENADIHWLSQMTVPHP